MNPAGLIVILLGVAIAIIGYKGQQDVVIGAITGQGLPAVNNAPSGGFASNTGHAHTGGMLA